MQLDLKPDSSLYGNLNIAALILCFFFEKNVWIELSIPMFWSKHDVSHMLGTFLFEIMYVNQLLDYWRWLEFLGEGRAEGQKILREIDMARR